MADLQIPGVEVLRKALTKIEGLAGKTAIEHLNFGFSLAEK